MCLKHSSNHRISQCSVCASQKCCPLGVKGWVPGREHPKQACGKDRLQTWLCLGWAHWKGLKTHTCSCCADVWAERHPVRTHGGSLWHPLREGLLWFSTGPVRLRLCRKGGCSHPGSGGNMEKEKRRAWAGVCVGVWCGKSKDTLTAGSHLTFNRLPFTFYLYI